MLNDMHICSCRNWLAPSDHCRQQWNAGWPVVLVLVCRRPADRYLQWSSLLRPLDLWSPVRCLVMLERLDCLSWATETISTHLGRLCIALSWTLYAAHSWFFGCTAVPGIRCGLLLPLYCAICVCLLATRMSHANMTEPIEMPFGMSLGETMYWVCAWISPQERALVGLPRLASGQFFQACLLGVQEQCGLWLTCLL